MERRSNQRNKVALDEEARQTGLLVLVAHLRPFLSFFAAVAIAVIILAFVAGRFSPTLTEVTFFILAPYYAFIIVLHAREFFGDDRGTIFSALALAVLAALVLYACDAIIRFFAFGHIRVALAPAPTHMILLGSASAIVETVVIQLGIQARIRGWSGVAIVSIFFFAIHLSLNPFFLIAGIMLALLQAITRRPGSTLMAHLVYNGLIGFVPPL